MSSPPARLLLALAVAGSVSAWSAAGAGRVLAPEAGDTLVAGTVVEVRWEALAPDVDEFELLLSIDDREATQIRLTPQLEPGTDGYLWLVPNLPTDDARLRLRTGHHGVEVEGEPTGSFRIVGRRDRPVAALRFSGGEWWAGGRVAPSTAPERRPLSLAPSTAPDLTLAEAPAPASPLQLVPPPQARIGTDAVGSSGVVRATGVSTPRRPRTVPLRE